MKSTLVTRGIRTKLKKAMGSKPVLAAVAYVSDVDGFPLGAGDTVVCDASRRAAGTGSTRKDALLLLVNNKVKVWSVEGLHAKVVVAGEKAFVGSANWSKRSNLVLEEAVIETVDPGVVAAAKAYVGELVAGGAVRVNKTYIKKMPDPPSQTGGGAGGKFGADTRHWLVGLFPLSGRLKEVVEPLVKPYVKKLSGSLEGKATIEWFRLAPSVYLGQRLKKGDWITASWRDDKITPRVSPPCLIVENVVIGKHRAIFYRIELDNDILAVAWKVFHKQAVKSGMNPKIKVNKDIEITQAQAQALAAWWAARQAREPEEALTAAG